MDTERPGLIPIGSFASAARLSLKALRIYHQLGILPPAYIDPDSGYRYYRIEQLREARLIGLLRQMEMPLAKIRRVVEADGAEAEDMVLAYRMAVEAQAARVRSTVNSVLTYLRQEKTDMAYTVEVQYAEAQVVASINKRVKIDGLNGHIRGSLSALHSFVHEQGGEEAGHPFGIFYGPVNQEDNGPVEVCVPVRGKFAPTGDIQIKEMPAAKIACVTMTGEGCFFPKILEAYDAASDWIARNGYEMADAPREVWIGDFSSPENERMMVAWPFRERK